MVQSFLLVVALLLLYNDFNDKWNGECTAFDTNTCYISSRDDIDASVEDGDPLTIFIHTTDVVASIRGLIGLPDESYLHNIYLIVMLHVIFIFLRFLQ